MRDPSPPASGSNVTIAVTNGPSPKSAPNATANISIISAPDRSKAKSASRKSFPPPASAAWTATPSAAATIMERLLHRLHSGEINLLVGTQMIAKGHDIHGITLVGVVGADYALVHA